MDLTKLAYSTDFNQGTFGPAGTTVVTSRLDTTTYISSLNHPAILPGTALTSTTTQNGAQVFASTTDTSGLLPAAWLSNTQGTSPVQWTSSDQYLWTTQSGDALSFQTTARQVTLSFVGYAPAGQSAQAGPGYAGRGGLVSGQFRNGALASVSLDGTVSTQVDTYNGTPSVTLYLDGATHTVQVSHSGAYNSLVQPVSSAAALVTAGGSNSVLNGLSLTAQSKSTFVSASWRVVATGAGAFSLYKTPQGGSESLVASGLATGTVYNASNGNYVPGVTLLVTGTLTTTDSVTFRTDVVMVVLQSVAAGYGAGASGGSYTTPVLDSGAADTQWFLAEWDQNVALNSVGASVGQTPTPDHSWSTETVSPLSTTLPRSGVQRGCAALQGLPAGRYAQLQLNFAAAALTQPWVRDLKVYSWTPRRDRTLLSKLALGSYAAPGATLQSVAGVLETFLADTLWAARQFASSMTISQATDQYLYAYGTDLQLPPYTGESPQAYQARISAAFASRQQGGSIPFIRTQLNLLTQGSANPTTPVTVTAGGGQSFSIIVPPPTRDPISGTTAYVGLPGVAIAQAQSIITTFASTVLRPVGAVLSSITFQGS